MHIDSTYTIGSSHLVCQDYCRSGTINDVGYIIVSDGCSSAIDSDVGARLLVIETEEIIKELSVSLLNNNPRRDALSVSFLELYFKSEIRNKIYVSQKYNYLNSNCFSATLFVCLAINGRFFVFGWGDGVVSFLGEKNNKFTIGTTTEIEYPSGAPYYLNYYFDINRKKEYETMFGGIVRHVVNGVETKYNYDKSFVAEYNNASTLIITTDGIQSFYYLNNHPDASKAGSSIDYMTILTQILDFKQTEGKFLKRKIQFLKKNFDKEFIEHYDDLGIAGIIL